MMSPGGYPFPPGPSTATVVQSRRLSGTLALSYDRPPAALPFRGRSPSPGPSRIYNSYEDYPPSRSAPAYREGGYPTLFRSNSSSYRDFHPYHPPDPLTDRHHESLRDAEPDYWDRPAPWQPPEKPSWLDRRALTLSPTSSVISRDRNRNDAAPRLFEPSDAWKQTQNDPPRSFSPKSPRHGRNFQNQSPVSGRSPPPNVHGDRYRPDQTGRPPRRINSNSYRPKPRNSYRPNFNRYRDAPRRRASNSISSSRSRRSRSRSRSRLRSRSRSRSRSATRSRSRGRASLSNSSRRSVSRYTGSDRRRSKSRSLSRSSIASSRASDRVPSRRVSPIVASPTDVSAPAVEPDSSETVHALPAPSPSGSAPDIVGRGPSHSPVPGLGGIYEFVSQVSEEQHKLNVDRLPSPLIQEKAVPQPETASVEAQPTISKPALPTWDATSTSRIPSPTPLVVTPVPPAAAPVTFAAPDSLSLVIVPLSPDPTPMSPRRISMSPPRIQMSPARISSPPAVSRPRSLSPMSVEAPVSVPVEEPRPALPSPNWLAQSEMSAAPHEDAPMVTQPKIDLNIADIPNMADAKNIVDALRTVVMTRLLLDRQTRQEIVDPILTENLTLESPPGETPLKTQSQLVEEVSVQRFNGARDDPFLAAKPWLSARFARRQTALSEKRARLQAEYQELHTEWRRHCRSISVCVKPVETENIPVSGRTTRRSAATLGDTVRSDLEMEQIIASLGYDEATDPNQLSAKNLATIPDMIAVTGQTKYVYDDTNHLVDDPSSYYAPYTGIHDWTDQEKETFLDKYAAFPKQFGTIASFLPNKTATQCVDYYYLHKKKLIDFRRAVSRFAPGKRRGRRAGKQKGNGLLSDIRQHDAEVQQRESDGSSGLGRSTRGRRSGGGGVPDSVRKPSGRRNALQLEVDSTATPTPEPEVRPKRRRAAARSGLYTDDVDEDTDGEPKKKRRGRKPKSAAVVVAEELLTPAVTPPPSTVDVELEPLPALPAAIQWSSEDKILFLGLLAQHGENFKRIAVAMPNKTTAQVAEYFKAHFEELDLGAIVAGAMAMMDRAAGAGDADTTLSPSVPSPLLSADDAALPPPEDEAAPPQQNDDSAVDANEMWERMDPGGSGVQQAGRGHGHVSRSRSPPAPEIPSAASLTSELPVEESTSTATTDQAAAKDKDPTIPVPNAPAAPAPVMSSLNFDSVWGSYYGLDRPFAPSAFNADNKNPNPNPPSSSSQPPSTQSPAAAVGSRPPPPGSMPYPGPVAYPYYMPYPPPYSSNSGSYKSS